MKLNLFQARDATNSDKAVAAVSDVRFERAEFKVISFSIHKSFLSDSPSIST